MAYGDWIKGRLWSQVRGANAIYDKLKEHGFGWWFAYFWKEIAIKNRDDRALIEVIADVLAPMFPANIAVMSSVQQGTEATRVAGVLNQMIPEPADLNARSAYYLTMLLSHRRARLAIGSQLCQARGISSSSVFMARPKPPSTRAGGQATLKR